MAKQGIFRRFVLLSLWVVSAVFLHYLLQSVETLEKPREEDVEYEDEPKMITMDEAHERANMFLIFIGGMPRSGTTLMRTMLDAHPDIRCGQETHVIPELLGQKKQWLGSASLMNRLAQAGVYPEAMNNAIAQFILEIVLGHGPPAKYFCNKDPYTQSSTVYLHKLFPNAKFIFMMRDGRAFAHSVFSRGVVILNYDITNYRSLLQNWNFEIEDMYKQCQELGENVCLPVYYEQLVLQPISNTKRIFEFLGIPWNERILHHEQHINETKLSSFEFSTDQVQKPLYLDALKSWFGKIPKDVERDMGWIAPMLNVLGYDPYDPTPNYGEPDEFVLKQMSESERKSYTKRHKK